MQADLPPHVDLAWRDPDLEHAARALVVRDIAPALELLARDAPPDQRDLRVEVLGQAGQDVLVDLDVAAEHEPDRLLLLGSALNAAAWWARGALYAEHTTDEQLERFIDLTSRAREALRRATEAAPADSAPWSALMSCALGAPEREGEGGEVFAGVVARAPDLVSAHERRLQGLAAKWYGSHEQMLDFARGRVVDLPNGHPLLALVPAAHIEVHLHDSTAPGMIRRWRAMDYPGRRIVRAEVGAASDRLLAGGGTERAHARWIRANQVFAAYYNSVADVAGLKPEDAARLARHVAEGGERPARWPWGYFGDHHVAFEKARRLAAEFR
ncbi:hypothetical protein [Saccharothrix xinjiangensis]|uniref:Uncharacterized protein n=1 Tax=Saccharothrix xinjiangensis TaxID=204798 RepID=A0ABV9YCY5_9PSEU